MAIANLNNKRFKFGSRSYFVAGAHECQIGAVGKKRAPVGKPKNLDVKDYVNPTKIGSLTSDVVDIQLNIGNTLGLREIIPIPLPVLPVPIPVGFKSLSKKMLNGDLKLLHLWASDSALKKALNNSPRLRDDMIEWGSDARIVSQIFVVIEASVAQKFRSNKTVKIGASAGGSGQIGAEVGGDGGRAGRISINFSPGSVIAYQLADIDWDAKRKKNKDLVVDLNDDQFGTG